MGFDPEEALLRLDAIIVAQLAAILDHPALAFLESWRTLRHFVDQLNFRENIGVDFIPCTRDELQVNLAATPEPRATALGRWLDRAEEEGTPYAVLMPCFDVDVEFADRASRVADHLDALLVANVEDLGPFGPLRKEPRSRHLVLTSQRFVETPTGPTMGAHLLVAAAVADEFAVHRHGGADQPDPRGGRPASPVDGSTLRAMGGAAWIPTDGERLACAELRSWHGEWLSDTMLPARWIHYFRVLVRRVLPPLGREKLERELNRWLEPYVAYADVRSPAVMGRRPLRGALVRIEEECGWYHLRLSTTWHRHHHRTLHRRAPLCPVPTPQAIAEARVRTELETEARRPTWTYIAPTPPAPPSMDVEVLLQPMGPGGDVTQDDRFLDLCAEMEKLTRGEGEEPNWRWVLVDAASLLTDVQKDFRVAIYLLLAHGMSDGGADAWERGFALVVGMVERHWQSMQPPLHPSSARRDIVDWLVERLEAAAAERPPASRATPGSASPTAPTPWSGPSKPNRRSHRRA